MPSDTPSRCEPPEEWRKKDGSHFLRHSGQFELYEWLAADGGFWVYLGGPEAASRKGYVYITPCNPAGPALPDATAAAEIERLRAENEQMRGWMKAVSDGQKSVASNVWRVGDAALFYKNLSLAWEARDAIMAYREHAARAALARERTA